MFGPEGLVGATGKAFFATGSRCFLLCMYVLLWLSPGIAVSVHDPDMLCHIFKAPNAISQKTPMSCQICLQGNWRRCPLTNYAPPGVYFQCVRCYATTPTILPRVKENAGNPHNLYPTRFIGQIELGRQGTSAGPPAFALINI